jgi:hypothetical protein
MSNILTWDIKPIQLPKLNSNLLSMVSSFVLCLILFTVSVAAVEVDCEDEIAALNAAQKNYAITGLALIAAETAFVISLFPPSPATVAALIAIGICTVALKSSGDDLEIATNAYWDCMNPPQVSVSAGCTSGGCVSAGCTSGGCGV